MINNVDKISDIPQWKEIYKNNFKSILFAHAIFALVMTAYNTFNRLYGYYFIVNILVYILIVPIITIWYINKLNNLIDKTDKKISFKQIHIILLINIIEIFSFIINTTFKDYKFISAISVLIGIISLFTMLNNYIFVKFDTNVFQTFKLSAKYFCNTPWTFIKCFMILFIPIFINITLTLLIGKLFGWSQQVINNINFITRYISFGAAFYFYPMCEIKILQLISKTTKK